MHDAPDLTSKYVQHIYIYIYNKFWLISGAQTLLFDPGPHHRSNLARMSMNHWTRKGVALTQVEAMLLKSWGCPEEVLGTWNLWIPCIDIKMMFFQSRHALF